LRSVERCAEIRRALMTSRHFSKVLLLGVIAFANVFCAALLAQGPTPDAPAPTADPAASAFVTPASVSSEHKFWDKWNCALFAAAAGSNSADFAVTRANLQSGGRELNPVVRVFGSSSTGLAVNFAGETASVMGIAYFFHKTGHHRMERMVSVVDMGASVGAVSYGLTHSVSTANSVEPRLARHAGFAIRIKLPSR
jgi:hypothetical protein